MRGGICIALGSVCEPGDTDQSTIAPGHPYLITTRGTIQKHSSLAALCFKHLMKHDILYVIRPAKRCRNTHTHAKHLPESEEDE